MTIKEAAERLGKTPKAIERHIERKSKLGQIFELRKGRRFCYAKDLNKFM